MEMNASSEGVSSPSAGAELTVAGKVLRDGMGQASGRSDKDVLDLVITNALVVDWTGIYKVSLFEFHQS